MIRIGITGQAGFLGTHLYNFFGLQKEAVKSIPFEDNFFDDMEKLEGFVQNCDVIIHLAAVNRHADQNQIYATNILLVRKLIEALERSGSTPHLLFASSTQEERDNVFGRSKKEGRELLSKWAEKNGAPFTGLIIPNVFGPFGNPYYNSVVATFSHQLTHGEEPVIQVDAALRLIYIDELVNIIYSLILQQTTDNALHIPFNKEITVTGILGLMKNFKTEYFENGLIPDLSDSFERDLFNTFVCYMDIERYYPFKLKQNSDVRGNFTELIRMKGGGQVSFSTTRPGITRGDHFHTRKAERFAVVNGKAEIKLRRIGTDKVMVFYLDGERPSYVDMPVWHTHNITNVGKEDLLTIFWTNEFFDPEHPDTFYEKV